MSDRPIAWSGLKQGTSVRASDGEEIGKVTDVIADEQKDIFSGITIRTGLFESDLFVPADLVAELTENEVRLTISAGEAERLKPHES
jgi:uncharacterized protein YrrD